MDETFTFIAPVMPKRAVHPMAIRAALISSLFVASVGALGVYVVQHEQAADARREALAAQVAAAAESHLEEATVGVEVPAGMNGSMDQAAQQAAGEALGRAQAVLAEGGSLAEAGAGQLATLGSSLLFVDGPSTAPTIVSVAVTDSVWAAAVATSNGCVWIALTADGAVARDHGEVCTGEAALAASGSAW
jgi:hypothetical protein